MCGGGGVLGTVAKIAAPALVSLIPGIGPLAAAALAAGAEAGVTKITGGSWGDALKSGAMAGIGSAAMPMLGNAFSSAFPETAASLGISQSPTVLDSLGLGSPLSATANGGTSVNGAMPFSNDPYAAESNGMSPALSQANANNMASADASAIHSGNSTWQNLFGTGGASGSGNSSGRSGSGILGSNPLGLVLGGASLVSGLRQRQQQEDQAKQMAASNSATNAQNTANWQQTLSAPPLPRQIAPGVSNIDWTKYGYGPEQQFLTNNQLNPSQFITNAPINARSGGRIRKFANGGLNSVTMPGQGMTLPPIPRGSSTLAPFRSLSPQLKPLSMSAGVKKITHGFKPGRAHKYAQGGSYPRRNGHIKGPGGPTEDKIPAMLSNGEYVVKARSVNALGGGNNNIGADILDTINNGHPEKLRSLGQRVRAMKETA